ncbi:MAG: PP2C family protein-serine/threonine phosphatase, partial [Desulfobacteraceae bacterium]|nr:PP2C family protein-serine/threonine phosphatase [Desulfobacteraceae bacterium]
LVSDAGGAVLAKTGQLPPECLWLKEGYKIEPDSPVASRCATGDCPFSKGQVCVPIEAQGNVVGYVLSCSDDDRDRATREITSKLVSDSVARDVYSEFELNSLSTEILDRYEEINLLYDIGETLGAVFDVDTIYKIVLEKGREVIGARKAWIIMLDREGENLHLAAAEGLSEEETTRLGVSAGEGICGKVAEEGRPLLIEEAEQLRPGLQQTKDISEIEPFVSFPMMCVPLKVKERVLGVINMSEKRSQQMFTAGDLKLLSAIASQAAISIYNSQLVEELKESERVKRDMEVAERIQMSLLPEEPPRFGGVELAGRCVPAKNIGGDYYDFFAISEDELCIVIADVSGHSIGPALVMAATRSVLRSVVLQNSDPSAVLSRTSTIIYDDLTGAGLFISMFYVRYNRKTGVLTYANGGHNLPLVYRPEDGECITLDAEGMLLGVLDDIDFDQGSVKLGKGDILVLYTDGITEAANSAAEQFGEERLYRVVQQNSDMTAQGLLDEVYRQVYQHSGDVAQYDDITMVVMKVTD